MDKIDKATGIRNFAVKTLLAVIGLYFVIGTGHKHVADLCNELQWDRSDTYLMISGFILAAGAAFYNRIIDAGIKKFEK
ncbi:hypothetical protein [Spongiimicrobium salis]|uniref:hypothetical protein n=1 Tax=Spongiimicrobium salis TaxID=1667022 RepID=UPI00374D9E7A